MGTSFLHRSLLPRRHFIGGACIQWFEGMDGDSGPMGLLQRNGTPRPSYTAMAQMIRHLGQRPTYLGWVMLNGKDWGFNFSFNSDGNKFNKYYIQSVTVTKLAN